MATVTAPYVVSRTGCLNHHGSARTEAKAGSPLVSLNSQGMTYDGLKSMNKLNMKTTHATNISVSVRSKKSGSDRSVGKIVCETGMTFLFVSAEVGPWSKTGGLGDVLGALPQDWLFVQIDSGKWAPCYDSVSRYDQYRMHGTLVFWWRVETVRYFHCFKRGVDRVFVDHPVFLEKVWGKTQSKLYGPKAGEDYADNQFRFSLLCLAALEAPRVLNLNSNPYFSGPYGEDVVFIANDWHTALLPCYLKSMKLILFVHSWQVAFCIHNIAYQGRFAFADFPLLGLPDEFRSSFDFMDGYDKPVKGRKINWMKAGIIESDRVVTVSPYYAQELVSGEDRGVELDTIIRSVGITGIRNGMDHREWSPKTDRFISIHYDATTVTEAKCLLKQALQAECGLPVDSNIPVIGFIGRLEEQKGSDILFEAISKFIHLDVQIIVLVRNRQKYMEKQIEQLEELYPEKARGIAKFNTPLAHKIIAGADFIVIPSRFEPCGLVQLHAMPYGTVPIVSSTGGLVDTVIEGYTGFHAGAFSVELTSTVIRALTTFGTPVWKEIVQNCMAQDFSWKEPAKLWEKMLLSLGVAGSEPGIEGEEIAPLAKENLPTLEHRDFNEIVNVEERKGTTSLTASAEDFKDWIQDINLLDLLLNDRNFTWFRGRSCSRIDRVLVSLEWVEEFPEIRLRGGPRGLSDHCSMIVEDSRLRDGPRPFRSLDSWFTHEDFFRMVKEE
ncbi:Granule-bound starch synthase 1 [Arachis hypogaea]|uniref:Starch synthase, chloroplastic/amyloplastic n=1 Tax=Arachis hypogaea TaxID=3818 RepID=A0A6B9VB09_ARAHY|nr:Granule-bound starch synthase 1 [Arachis hypogaea]